MQMIDPNLTMSQLIGSSPAAVAVIVTVAFFIRHLNDRDKRDLEERGQMRKELHNLVEHNDGVIDKNTEAMNTMTRHILNLECNVNRYNSVRRVGQ